jgi:hypothetical protein
MNYFFHDGRWVVKIIGRNSPFTIQFYPQNPSSSGISGVFIYAIVAGIKSVQIELKIILFRPVIRYTLQPAWLLISSPHLTFAKPAKFLS